MSAGIYIHWPFCVSKCPYCDFNIYLNNDFDADVWIDSYVRSLSYYANNWDEKEIGSIYFGGGTPSLMRENDVQTIIDCVYKNWRVASNVEITLEANPTSSEIEKFRAFKKSGINRLSLGVQSFEDRHLKFLGRLHCSSDVFRAVDVAQNVFERMSFDLIYAMPDQSLKQWEDELTLSIPYLRGHLSAYQLTIKEGTAFYQKQKRGEIVLPENDLSADFYLLTNNILEQENMPLYEVSNYARQGEASRHNLVYWQYQDYLGIGPGAHGRVNIGGKKYESYDYKKPSDWFSSIREKGHGAEVLEPLSQASKFEEMVMMGLRLRVGLNLEKLRKQTGLDFLEQVDKSKIQSLIDNQWLKIDQKNAQLTEQGMLRTDSILGYLLG